MIYYLATYVAVTFILSLIYSNDIRKKNHISEPKYWGMIFIWPIITILAIIIGSIQYIGKKSTKP